MARIHTSHGTHVFKFTGTGLAAAIEEAAAYIAERRAVGVEFKAGDVTYETPPGMHVFVFPLEEN